MPTTQDAKVADRESATRRVAIRGTREWTDWLDRGAAYCRTDVAKLIDAALIDYLKGRGFDEPPPPRT
ncbi:MAG: hypothetical protein ACLQVF_15665 [Isosphaeraceae bacterium]